MCGEIWSVGPAERGGCLTSGGPAGEVAVVMNIDAYTKIVLTVIAGCLVYLVARDLTLVPKAHAQAGSAVMDVNIVQIAGAPLSAPGNSRDQVTLPVSVFSQ